LLLLLTSFNAGKSFHKLSGTIPSLQNIRPIASYWDPFEHFPQKCVDRQALTVATQGVNSISDLLIFLWPARTLWGVRLPKQQRFGLVFVFSIGVV
jgi:hypothetical protein